MLCYVIPDNKRPEAYGALPIGSTVFRKNARPVILGHAVIFGETARAGMRVDTNVNRSP